MVSNQRKILLTHGFSMVEIVIVLSIIAIMAGAATLSFSGSIDYAKLQQASAQVSADLKLVRDQAKRDQQSYSMIFDRTNLCYYAPGVTNLDGPEDISVDLSKTPYQLSSIECIDSEEKTVTFDVRGRCVSAGYIELHRGSKKVVIEINEDGNIEQIN